MIDLAEFLLARIAEDGAAAERAGARGVLTYMDVRQIKNQRGEYMLHPPLSGSPPWDAWVEHSEHWAPGRVLAECEAKQRIIHEYEGEIHRGVPRPRPDFEARHGGILDAYRATLRLLALPYADHPDYREEWKP